MGLSDWLTRVSKGWLTLLALITMALFMVLVLPAQSRQAEAVSGGAGSPDTSFFYTPADLYRMAEQYGPAGRAAYIRARFTFDLVFPLVYTAFLATALSWLNQRASAPASPWRLTNLAPVLGMAFDYLENIATSIIMGRYPATTPGIDALAPIFTFIKWILVAGSFVLLLISIVMAAWQWQKRRRTR